MTKILVDKAVIEQALNAMNLAYEGKCQLDTIPNATDALRAALEPPQGKQEPVAWMFQHDNTWQIMYVDEQQVEWDFEKGNPRWKKIYPVYLNPQPKRQPLTDEQIIGAVYGDTGGYSYIEFARAIERAHGIGGDA